MQDRVEFLSSLGLATQGDKLAPAKTAKPKVERPAPTGADPRTMPVDEIVFDPSLLDQFPSLEGDGLKAASDHVFSIYKSYGRNKERNGMLHRKITTFITQTRRARLSGGEVTEGIKATTQQRDMAALIAEKGVSVDELAEALVLLAEKRGANV